MKRDLTGRYVETEVRGQRHNAFIPEPLPPDPPLRLDGRLAKLSIDAATAAGHLDGVSAHLPAKELFIYTYIRKEAVLSSQIEGLQSSLQDLLLHEIQEKPGVPVEDAREVAYCVEAIVDGWDQLEAGAQLSNDLLRKLHATLMKNNRPKAPGEFRQDQVCIGSSRTGEVTFVPPTATEVEPCMLELEHFVQDKDGDIPALTRAGLAHVQFETIHPFLDGNGRLGRILINLMLDQPLLHLSLFFKRNQQEYYNLLNAVRLSGSWEAWMEFFFEGVLYTARDATAVIQRIGNCFNEDESEIKRTAGLRAGSVLQVHEILKKRVIMSVPAIAKVTHLTYPTISAAMEWLVERGMTSEITHKRSNRIYCYDEYYNILTEDIG